MPTESVHPTIANQPALRLSTKPPPITNSGVEPAPDPSTVDISFMGTGSLGEDSPIPSMSHVLNAVSALIDAINCTISGERDSARQHVTVALHCLESSPAVFVLPMPHFPDATAEKFRGGLAPWQIRRISTYIEEHLGDPIQCDDLARLVRLTLSHFMRAFRESFGCPPHTYLMKRRVELAQGLMLTTDTALGHIALECGLADQSHLSRLFRKFVGESPAVWRRARVTAV